MAKEHLGLVEHQYIEAAAALVVLAVVSQHLEEPTAAVEPETT